MTAIETGFVILKHLPDITDQLLQQNNKNKSLLNVTLVSRWCPYDDSVLSINIETAGSLSRTDRKYCQHRQGIRGSTGLP